MNTQSQTGAPLSQLRSMLESMSVATLSSIDAHGALLSSRMSRWEMDDGGALWFFADPLCPPVAHLSSINLSFADAARTRRVSLSGRGEIYAEDLASEYLLGAIWLGRINPPRFASKAQLHSQTLLKFIPQSAVYWHAQPSLLARLFALLASVFGAKAAPAKPAMHCVELPPA
ncbi:MAG TPA: pyridoxamine 5'-phosphate oxidase family protein [Pseudomonas sp.]|nr:pyridoxamine 5'-phosphate oxidase family protein [Pseudomonas sp.]